MEFFVKKFINFLLYPLRPIRFCFLGALGSAIAGGISAVAGPVVSGLFGSRDTDKTNQTNKDISNDNLAFQRENLEYQKALQEKVFQREDSAYQRTVQDMRAAGLSPLAMNGTNGAGEAIQTVAPQNTYQRQGKSYQFLSDAVNKGIETATNLMRLKNEKDKNDAEIRNIDANTASTLANTDFFNASASARLAGLYLNNRNSAAQYENISSNTSLNRIKAIGAQLDNMSASDILKYNRYFGINPQMSREERLGSLVLRLSGFEGSLTSANAKDLVKAVSDFIGHDNSKNTFTNVSDILFSPSNPISSAIQDKLNGSILNDVAEKAKDYAYEKARSHASSRARRSIKK